MITEMIEMIKAVAKKNKVKILKLVSGNFDANNEKYAGISEGDKAEFTKRRVTKSVMVKLLMSIRRESEKKSKRTLGYYTEEKFSPSLKIQYFYNDDEELMAVYFGFGEATLTDSEGPCGYARIFWGCSYKAHKTHITWIYFGHDFDYFYNNQLKEIIDKCITEPIEQMEKNRKALYSCKKEFEEFAFID